MAAHRAPSFVVCLLLVPLPLLPLPSNLGREADYHRQDATPAENEKRCAIVDTLTLRDTRQFLRAGFREAPEPYDKRNCRYLFAVPDFVRPSSPMMAHAAALAVDFTGRTPPAAPAPTGKDQELFGFVRNEIDSRGMDYSDWFSDAVLPELVRGVCGLLEAGATIGGSHVLHLLAAHQNANVLMVLMFATAAMRKESAGAAALRESPVAALLADIDGLDQNGVTPLMVAAATAPGKVSSIAPAPPLECCTVLMQFGADKNVVDRNARTQSCTTTLPRVGMKHGVRVSCVCVCMYVCVCVCVCAWLTLCTARHSHEPYGACVCVPVVCSRSQGLTALGHMWQARRRLDDSFLALGLPLDSDCSALEAILLPASGPTDADVATRTEDYR